MISRYDLNRFSFYRGRVAQAAILKALGVTAGDQVAIQAFTCLAVPEGIYAVGAKPIYIDIEQNGYNMCPASLEQNITSDTKAIIVQHTYGIPAQVDKIIEIASFRGIPVIEDCCHSLESYYKSRKLGTFGLAAFYSFEWGKPIAAGLGGAIIVNDPDLELKIERLYYALSNPPFFKQLKIELQYQAFSFLYRPAWYWAVRYAFRALSRVGAAEGNFNNIEKITKGNISEFSMKMSPQAQKRLDKKICSLEQISSHSRKVCEFYKSEIKTDAVVHPVLPKDSDVIFARYPLRTKQKNTLLKQARKNNIELADWYVTPIHPIPTEQAHLIGYIAGSCPNAEQRSREIVTLPTYSRVDESFLKQVQKYFTSF